MNKTRAKVHRGKNCALEPSLALEGPQNSNTPGILQTTQPPPKPCTRISPGSNLVFPSRAVQPIRAHAPNQNRAPKRQQKVPRHPKTVCMCPQASSAPKYSTLDDRQSHRALSGLRPPQGSQKAIIPRPSMRDRGSSSAWSFRPWVQAPLGTSLPRARPRSPLWRGVYGTKRVWISKWPPPLMRSLLSSSHVIKRASLTVSPGIPIIIANQCSGVHHLCGVVTIRAFHILPCMRPRPHNQDPSPFSDESRYGGPGRSV